MAGRARGEKREARSENPSRFPCPVSRFQSSTLPLRRVRDDALPENINYVDTGCDVWPKTPFEFRIALAVCPVE